MDVIRFDYDAKGEPYIQLGENVLRFEQEELDEFYRERAKREIRETPENVKNGIDILRQFVKDEKNLNVPLDEEFMLMFLRPCKFYPDSAFKIMKKYYKVKLKQKKYFTNILPEEVADVYDAGMLYFLPKRCEDGSRIMVVNAGNRWDTKKVSVVLLIKALLLAVQIAMGEPKTQACGVHVILDMEGLSMSHVCQFTPGIAKFACNVVTECLALRLLGYHIINQSIIFDILFNIFKPFLGEKIRKRVFFHGRDWESLHHKVDSQCMPKDWGGSLNSPECPGDLLNKIMQFYRVNNEKASTYGYTSKIDIENN